VKSVDLMSLWAFVCSVLLCFSVRERKVLRERYNANYANKECQYTLQTVPFYNRQGTEYESRKGPSTFENMPLLHIENALLEARRACSQMLFVTFSFRVGYKCNRKRRYTLI